MTEGDQLPLAENSDVLIQHATETKAAQHDSVTIMMGSASNEEFRVSFVLGLILSVFSLLFFLSYRLLSENRKRIALPLLTFIFMTSADMIYKSSAELESFYGSRPFEFSLARTALLCITAKLLALRYFNPAEEYIASMEKKGIEEPLKVSRRLWFFWFPIIGFIWGVEECLIAYPESFIGLLISWLAMCLRFKSVGSRLGALFVPVTVAGVLMARSGAVSLHAGLAGLLRIIRILMTDLLIAKQGPISPLVLTWGPGVTATVVTGLAYLIFEYAKPITSHSGAARGILDYTAAAGLGMFFTLASTLAMFETMVNSSLLSMQAASCFTEILVFCFLAPLAGLPMTFHVMLGLNIAGIVLGLFGSLVVMKTDKFAGASNLSHSIFKFLDEEENIQPSGSIREIGEDEWLLTMKQAPV